VKKGKKIHAESFVIRIIRKCFTFEKRKARSSRLILMKTLNQMKTQCSSIPTSLTMKLFFFMVAQNAPQNHS